MMIIIIELSRQRRFDQTPRKSGSGPEIHEISGLVGEEQRGWSASSLTRNECLPIALSPCRVGDDPDHLFLYWFGNRKGFPGESKAGSHSHQI